MKKTPLLILFLVLNIVAHLFFWTHVSAALLAEGTPGAATTAQRFDLYIAIICMLFFPCILIAIYVSPKKPMTYNKPL